MITLSKRNDGVYQGIYSPFMGNPNSEMKAISYGIYWRRLTEMSAQRFKWVGLPDSVDERFIELTLLFSGLVVYFYHNDSNRQLAMRGTASGALNIYDNPTSFTVIGNGLPSIRLSPKDCVPIWPNYLRIPENDIVRMYANRLAEFDRTIDINMMQQRKPFIVAATESQRLSLQNAYKNVVDGEFALFTADDTNLMDSIQPFDTGVDKDLVINGILAKKKIWDEAMTMLGIDNGNQEKKERMISDEVNANAGQVVAARNVSMNARQFAADNINRMFGTTISVEWNLNPAAMGDMPAMVEDVQEPIADEGDE